MLQSARRVPFALTVGVCAASALSACDVTIRDGDIKGVSVRARATQEWKRRYPLAEGGRVEIINSDGPIEVVSGPAGSVDVLAELEAQAMTDGRAKEILTAVSFEESATPDHVRVATARRREGWGDLDVSFKVTLPPNARLEMTGNNGRLKADGLQGHVKAMVVNGGVELTHMRGTVDAAAVNGSISAEMTEVGGPIRLDGTNGRITLELPKDTKATLNARAVNGGVTIRGLDVDEGSGRRIRTIESQLNGGGPEIDLRMTNGRITIEGK